ncbi:V-type proton ATPase subunit H [Eurytemora carolleeae]|uniref:V-type proton ATPase subunit H n=1 Tax=Eurytemora carolleeae TaxID=1294199 RepID=UPI000C763461|nr:V-type proton ATPase subunit H [Eurytemora carolleeae]|eukprot:XP_023339104.1 V-type proton ATPase subunit H-like [Eurytemora affinis]
MDLLETLPDDIEKGGDNLAATSAFQQKAVEVRGQRINWQSYLQSQMISEEDYSFISRYDIADSATREKIVEENPLQSARTFYSLIGHISKDQTIQYLLTLIDDFLQEKKNRVAIFREYARKRKESVWAQFLNLLNRPDGFIQNMTARVIAKMACWSVEPMQGQDLQHYLLWLKDQLKVQKNTYVQSVARCLQMMLRIDDYRRAFASVDGIAAIVSVLSGKVNFQVRELLIYVLSLIIFNKNILYYVRLNKFGVIPILADILSDAQKEKVSRIILGVFRNLIEKPEEQSVKKENCISMYQCKVMKQLELLEQRKFEDEDIQEDIHYLMERMEASVQDLSSYDEYVTEVKSGRLEWSPVHRSEKFWRENASNLNDKNYELLKILLSLLETARDPLVLCVACFDLGEYVRHYARGKHVLEQLGGKTLVMALLSHEDPNVRYEALLAVQKLMVHNWEYLGKQLEKPATEQGGSGIPVA